MTAKEDREDLVLNSFLLHLFQSGVTAELVEKPDRLKPNQRIHSALTTDGLVRVQSAFEPSDWSCDVMTLAAPISHIQIPKFIHDDLDRFAEMHKLHIRVEGFINNIEDRLILTHEICRQIQSGLPGPIVQGAATASWVSDAVGIVTLVLLLPSPSSNLSEQLIETLQAPLRSKATKQAAHAKKAGLNAAVLLDGVGADGLAQGPHWLHTSPSTVANAVATVLNDVQSLLDSVYYLHRDGTWHLIAGAPIR